MTVANQLVQKIAHSRMQLVQLEQQLKDFQLTCKHDFIEETTHRICRKCHIVESYHY